MGCVVVVQDNAATSASAVLQRFVPGFLVSQYGTVLNAARIGDWQSQAPTAEWHALEMLGKQSHARHSWFGEEISVHMPDDVHCSVPVSAVNSMLTDMFSSP